MTNGWTRLGQVAGGLVGLITLVGLLGVGQIKLFGLVTDAEMAAEIYVVREIHDNDIDILLRLQLCMYQDVEPFRCPAFEEALRRTRMQSTRW